MQDLSNYWVLVGLVGVSSSLVYFVRKYEKKSIYLILYVL